MSTSIHIENLDVNFDERFDLKGVDWTIEPNQHWVITGTNGSGKSALAAVLAGFGDALNGSIEESQIELDSFHSKLRQS